MPVLSVAIVVSSSNGDSVMYEPARASSAGLLWPHTTCSPVGEIASKPDAESVANNDAPSPVANVAHGL